jgi:hypothetical protein
MSKNTTIIKEFKFDIVLGKTVQKQYWNKKEVTSVCLSQNLSILRNRRE